MTTFNDKEKAVENKYAHDKEHEFKIHARRNKLLGLWVAGKLGLSGSAAEDYATAFVMEELEKSDDERLFKRIKHDLTLKEVFLSDHDIRAEMYQFLKLAKDQLAQ